MTDDPVTVLAVDDQPQNLRLLDAVLTPRGYQVLTAQSGGDALALLGSRDVDLVLLDVVMPELDGYEVCRRIRSDPATEFLPVVMITASWKRTAPGRTHRRRRRLHHQAVRPERAAGPRRVAGRIKRYHDTIRRQADELARWNAELEARVAEQVGELERTNRLRRFLSPQLTDLVISDEHLLESHRREIVVLFADLRNFTPFAETSEPEEVMAVLAEYHRAMGASVHAYEGTLERFTGDGIMVFFNDPVPCDDAAWRAVRTAIEIRDAVQELAARWRRHGHDLALGIGIAQGFATLGRIGFEGRFDYAAIGSVTNLAARLCSDAGPWQVLVTDRVLAAVETASRSEFVGDVQPKGFSRIGAGPQHQRDTGDEPMTRSVTESRPLSQLDEDERYRTFDALQTSMPSVWESMRAGFADESVVVVPSISMDGPTARSGTVMQAMEERALFLLLLLRQPRLRMIYVTSQPVSESIVEYYLGLLPGVIPRHARARLTVVPVGDASPEPLSSKLLARPRLLREIRALIPNPARCHLIPYNTTPLERDVALSLGIPMYGADPRLADLGTKSGCRRMFEQLGVTCPVGAEDLHTLDDIVGGVQRMRARRPSLTQAIVKLNDGVSGSGNALVDLRGLPAQGAPDEATAITERLLGMQLEAPNLALDVYLAAFEQYGGIVEERITGVALTSPSVQMRALPDGTVELLSTHDQLLGGASGQKYLGCVFPADPGYAGLISRPAMVIGRHLASSGFSAGSPWTSWWCRTWTAPGRRTRSSSTSARAAPPIRS